MLPDTGEIFRLQQIGSGIWPRRFGLINWLIDVHSALCLKPATLFLAVNSFDRYLSMAKVETNKLQLLGISSLSIAAMINDPSGAPSNEKFVEVCFGDYEVKALHDCKRILLRQLGFDWIRPGPLDFLERIARRDMACPLYKSARLLAQSFLEAMLPINEFIAERPSIVAAAAYCLGRFMLGMGDWVRFLSLSSDSDPRLTNL